MIASKPAAETVAYTFDFSQAMAEGEAIDGDAVVSVVPVDGADAAGMVGAAQQQINDAGNAAQVWLAGGVADSRYRVEVRVNTDRQQVLALRLTLKVG